MVLFPLTVAREPLFSSKSGGQARATVVSAGGESHAFPFSFYKPSACALSCTKITHLEVTINFCPFQNFSFLKFSFVLFTISSFSNGLVFTLILKFWGLYEIIHRFLLPLLFLLFCIFTSFSAFPLTLEIPKVPLLFDHSISVFLNHFFFLSLHPPRTNSHSLWSSSAPIVNAGCVCMLICVPQRAV